MKAPPYDDVSYFLNHWQLKASAGNDFLKNISVSLVITGELILALMMMMNAEKYVTMKKRNASVMMNNHSDMLMQMGGRLEFLFSWSIFDSHCTCFIFPLSLCGSRGPLVDGGGEAERKPSGRYIWLAGVRCTSRGGEQCAERSHVSQTNATKMQVSLYFSWGLISLWLFTPLFVMFPEAGESFVSAALVISKNWETKWVKRWWGQVSGWIY